MVTLLKTLTYGVMHITVATTIAYLLSGNFQTALSIGLLEPVVQSFFFYFHERGWNRLLQKRDCQKHAPDLLNYNNTISV